MYLKKFFSGKVNQKAVNGGSLHVGGKSEKNEWEEIKNQGPINFDNAKERKKWAIVNIVERDIQILKNISMGSSINCVYRIQISNL